MGTPSTAVTVAVAAMNAMTKLVYNIGFGVIGNAID
jgi:hypothetical protein